MRAKPWELPDGLWQRIEPLLPLRRRRYRYPGRKPRTRPLWQRLLGRPASESGTLRHGDGIHGRSDRCRRSFMLPILSAPVDLRHNCPLPRKISF
jgi:hypothetical protein